MKVLHSEKLLPNQIFLARMQQHNKDSLSVYLERFTSRGPEVIDKSLYDFHLYLVDQDEAAEEVDPREIEIETRTNQLAIRWNISRYYTEKPGTWKLAYNFTDDNDQAVDDGDLCSMKVVSSDTFRKAGEKKGVQKNGQGN